MNPQPKPKAYRNRKYLDWLREQPCIFSGRTPCDPHHVKFFGNGGTGIKPPDTDALPMLHEYHEKINWPNSSEWDVFKIQWVGYSRQEIEYRARGIADFLFEKFIRGNK